MQNQMACGPVPIASTLISHTLSFLKPANNPMLQRLCPSHEEEHRLRTPLPSVDPDSRGCRPLHQPRRLLRPLPGQKRPSLFPLLRGRQAPAHRLGQVFTTHLEVEGRASEETPRLYGKYFKGRATFLSLEFLPHFLAAQGTAVEVSDVEEFYEAGRISRS